MGAIDVCCKLTIEKHFLSTDGKCVDNWELSLRVDRLESVVDALNKEVEEMELSINYL